jgi:fibronectin-binding autotransporter adhesin
MGIETMVRKSSRWACSIVALVLAVLLVLPVNRAAAQTTITLGPATLSEGTYDTGNSNQVTQQGSFTLSGSAVAYSFTNNTGMSLQFSPSQFDWFSSQNPSGGALQGLITPYVVVLQGNNLQAANSQQVVSIGDTQFNTPSGLQTAAFISGFGNGSGSTFGLLPGQSIGIGFIDAYADGSAGTGPVIPFATAPAGSTWYYGSATLGTYSSPPTSIGTVFGGASTSGVTNRAYQFNVVFNYVGTDQGAWTGLDGATLDSNTQNFALNPSNSALTKGSLTDVQNDTNIPGIIFGDVYRVSGGTVAVSQNNLNVAAGGIAPSLPTFFTNNSVNYTIDSSDTVGIGGSTSISLMGTGSVTLTGQHSYTGSTLVSAGTLQLGNGTSGHDGVLATSSIVNNSALIYNVFGSVAPIYSISGNGSLNKSGNGTLILTPSNSPYTGSTAVNGGTLQIGDGTSDGSLTTSRIVNNAALVYNVLASQTASYPISGNGVLDKTGPGVLSLTGSNTYVGGTTVSAGTLTASLPISLPGYGTSGSVTVAGGALLGLKVAVGANAGWSSNQLDSIFTKTTFGDKTAGIGIDTSNGNFTYTSNVTQALSLTKLGANTLTLTGVNSYLGATTVNSGTLSIPSPGALPGAASGTPNPVAVRSGASLIVQTGTGATAWNSSQIASLVSHTTFTDSSSGLGIDTSSGNFTLNTSLTQAMKLSKLGLNTLTLTAANGSTGVTAINGGTLQLGDGTAGHDGSVAGNIVNNSALVYNLSGSQLYAGQVSGNGSLTKIGNGTLTLSGNSTYGGSTVVHGGTVKLAGAAPVSGVRYFKITGDSNSGISTSNTYTHAINPSGGGVSVNGVPFTGAGPGDLAAGSLTSQTYNQGTNTITIDNAIDASNFGANPIGTNLGGWNGATGNILDFYSHFNYNTAPLRTVVLGGLQPNTWYDVVLYEKQWDTSSGRTFSVGYDVGNSGTPQFTSDTIDQNHPELTPQLAALGIGQQNAWGQSYIYQTGDGQTSIALQVNNNPAATYHFYGLSNQLVPLTGNNVLPAGTLLTVAAGSTVDLNSVTQQVASLSDFAPGSGGRIINSGVSPSTLTLAPTSGSTTYSGSIQGPISLVMSGNGTQVLAGSNSYNGSTTVANGVLEATGAGSLPGYSSPGKVTVAAGGVLAVATSGASGSGWNSGQIDSLRSSVTWSSSTSVLGVDTTKGNFTYGSNITQALSLTKMGPNTLTLTGSNTYPGRTTVSSGTLQLGDGTSGHDGSVAGNVVNNAAVIYNLNGSQVYAGQITGNGSLIKSGNGTLILNNNSSYSGPTLVIGGTLKMQPNPSVPAGAVAAYTFADGATATDVTGNGNNGTLINAPGFVDGPAGPGSYAVSLDGATQYITVPYSSSLNVHAWTASAWVNLDANSATLTNGLIGTRFNSDTTYDLKISSNNTDIHSDIGSGSGWLNTSADAGFSFTSGQWYMVTQTVSSSGYKIFVNGNLIGSGAVGGNPLFMQPGQLMGIGSDDAGIEIFSGSMSDVYVYNRVLSPTEVTTLYNSVVAPGLSAANALPVGTPLVMGAGGKLDLNGFSQQVGSLSDYAPAPGGSIINSNTAATAALTISPAGVSSFSGSIQGPINLIMNGTGTQVLAGNNTYSGGTIVNSGILEPALPQSLPGYNTNGAVTVAAGGVLAVAPSGAAGNGWNGAQIDSLRSSVTWSSSTSVLGIDTSKGNFTYGSNITQALSLTKMGPNTLTLTGSNTYPGPTTVSGGTLQIGDGTAGHDGSLAGGIVNNSSVIYNVSGNKNYPGQINGSGSFTKAGNGTLTLSGFSNYAGPTVITAGTLKMQPVPTIPSGAVASYTFANDDGTDYSGNGNNGTLVNSPSFGPGPGGAASQAIILDGATQSVQVPYSSSLNVSAWTASAWVNITGTQTNGILGTRIPGGNFDHTFDMKVMPDNTTVHSDIGTGGNAGVTWLNTGADASAAAALNPGQWYMVTESVTSSGYSIYLNGNLIGSGAVQVLGAGTPLFMKAGQTLGIGQDYTTEFFSGQLAGVYVYNRALSPAEITALYNSVVAPTSASNALPVGTTVTIAAGANLDLNGYNQKVAAMADYAPGVGGNIVNSNAATTAALTLSPTGGSSTFSGVIQGPISLVMDGSGKQVLAGNNTYTGGTTVNRGILQPALPASLPGYNTSGAVTVAAGGVLAVATSGAAGSGWNGSQIDSLRSSVTWSSSTSVLGIDTSKGNFTYGSNITQALALSKMGPNTLTLTGSNTYLGPTTVSGGTLQLGDGTAGHDGSIAGNIVNNSALVYNLNGPEAYTGKISGNGSVTKTGVGTLTLAGNSTYSGATTVSGGTVKLLGLPPVGGLNYFKITGDSDSGILTSNTYTHAINPSGGNLSVNGVPFTGAGAGNLAAGNLTAQSYTQGAGTVTIGNSIGASNFGNNAIGTNLGGWSGVSAGGMLNFYSHFDYGTAPLRTVVLTGLQPNTWYDVVLYEKQWDTSTGRTFSVGYDVGETGTPQFTSPTIDQNQPQNTAALASLGIGQQNAWALSYIYETGDGQTSIALNVNNSTAASYHFYGLSNQVIPLIGNNVLPIGSALTVAANSTLDVNGVNQQVASLSDAVPGSGGSIVNSGASAVSLTLAPTAGSTTFSGAIQGPIGLVMNGPGTQVLSGNNSYTGGTTINQGVLDFSTQAARPSSGTVTVAAGATLGLGVGATSAYFGTSDLDALFSRTMPKVNNNPNSVVGIDTTAGNFTYPSSIPASTLGLTKLGPNTLTLTGANAFTGPTKVSGGTLQLGDGTAGHDGSIAGNIFNNSALVYNLNGSQAFNGQIVGTGSVTKTGSGTLTLAGNSGYAGPTTISGGVLKLGGQAPSPGINYFKITGDGDSRISAASTYTHAINPSGGGMSVNGVPFTGAGANVLAAGSLVPQTYSQQGANTVTIGNSIGSSDFGVNPIGTNLGGWSGVTGNMLDFYSHFNYGSAPLRTVVLTGLQPNTWYDLRLYEKQWDTSTGRVFSVGYDVGDTGIPQFTSLTVDQNHPDATAQLAALDIAQQSAWAQSYVYETGPGQTSIAVDINNSAAASYHFYGLTNQVVLWTLPIATTVQLGAASDSATLDLNGVSQQVAALSDNGTYTNGLVINSATGNPVTLTLTPSGGSSTFSGMIQGGGTLGTISVVMNGLGTQVLAGSNSYTGGTTISAGVLEITSTAALPGWNTTGAFSVAAGATLAVYDAVNDSNVSTMLATGNFGGGAVLGFDTSSGNRTLGINLADTTAGTLSLTKYGANTLIASGTNTYSGPTTINGGALQALDGVGLPGNSNLVLNGNLAKNAYGAAFESSGTFSRALGTGAGQVQWTGDGGFSANGGKLTVSISNSGSPLVWNNRGNSLGTPGFVADGNVLTFGSPTANAQVELTNSIDLNGKTRQIDVTAGLGGDSAKLSGNILDSQTGAGLLKTGAGNLVLSGSNTYNGGTTVLGGTLTVGNTDALLDGSSLTVGDPSAFAANGVVGSSSVAAALQGVTAVPEPGTLVLLAGGALLAGFAVRRYRGARGPIVDTQK